VPTDITSEQPKRAATVNAVPNTAKTTAVQSPTDPAAKRAASVALAGPGAMVAIPGGGSPLPGPLGEKHFVGEMECDFETALGMVRAADTRREERRRAGLWTSLRRLLGLGRAVDGAIRQDRHVAFDGFRTPLHDEKTERDRRYGTVYTVVEHANAYLVSLEMPRRIPASSLKELWRLPDEMPDYDYSITLHGNVLAVRAGVRGEAMRRLSYISASFPADFLTRIEFEQPVVAFKHRLRNKVLEIVVFKDGAEAARGAA
jgi:hypothetical protein